MEPSLNDKGNDDDGDDPEDLANYLKSMDIHAKSVRIRLSFV
jgi:hypothetical protein